MRDDFKTDLFRRSIMHTTNSTNAPRYTAAEVTGLMSNAIDRWEDLTAHDLDAAVILAPLEHDIAIAAVCEVTRQFSHLVTDTIQRALVVRTAKYVQRLLADEEVDASDLAASYYALIEVLDPDPEIGLTPVPGYLVTGLFRLTDLENTGGDSAADCMIGILHALRPDEEQAAAMIAMLRSAAHALRDAGKGA